MTSPHPAWLLLIVSLPTNGATARMRIWRNLKALGCAALRDGAYLLPHTPTLLERLDELAAETHREGGQAWLLTVQGRGEHEDTAFRTMFDRTEAHTAWSESLAASRQSLAQLSVQEINRALRKSRRDRDAIVAIDYFPGEAAMLAEAAWLEFVKAAEPLLSPGEPRPVVADVARLDPAAYQGRRWATRRGLWVDRVASAWLIGRFIDKRAGFLWLDTPSACPSDALGFDFDGAAFTHVGDRVTFEVLLASFGLEGDKGLARLGAMVHTLDVGGGFVAEAGGFEAMLSGARQRALSDDRILEEMGMVLDSLYAHFCNETPVGE